MKITAMKPFKGNDGKQLMRVRLSMGLVDGYSVGSIEGFAERLLQIMPAMAIGTDSAGTDSKGQGVGMAEVVARVALALQSSAGMPHSYWQVNDSAVPATYDITFATSDEAIGEYIARAAFRIVRSALYRQRYSLAPDLHMLALLVEQQKKTAQVLPLKASTAIAV